MRIEDNQTIIEQSLHFFRLLEHLKGDHDTTKKYTLQLTVTLKLHTIERIYRAESGTFDFYPTFALLSLNCRVLNRKRQGRFIAVGNGAQITNSKLSGKFTRAY